MHEERLNCFSGRVDEVNFSLVLGTSNLFLLCETEASSSLARRLLFLRFFLVGENRNLLSVVLADCIFEQFIRRVAGSNSQHIFLIIDE